MPTVRRLLPAAALLLLVFPTRVLAQDVAGVPLTDAPPMELADPIRPLLAPGAKVTAAKTELHFWWVKGLPVKDRAAWSEVEEGSLVGAVRLVQPYRDIRGKTVKPGVYTLRLGLQPQNGDHLGVSPFREFLLLSVASEDTNPAPIKHEPLTELSGKVIGSSHPAVWSIDPPAAGGKPLDPVVNEAGFKGLIFEVPVARDGQPAGALRFGLILIGEIAV
jgi:hypothetical protein